MTATYPDDDPPPLGGQDTPQSATPPEIRSPSPKRNLNILGLGLPESHSTPQTQSSAPSTASVLGSHPHLGHYIFNLLATASSSPPRGNGSALGSGQHPLSVSSSGESDDEDDSGQRVDGDAVDRTPQKNRSATTNRFSVAIGDKEDLVQRIVDLLDNEEEEKVKELLKPYLGELAKVSQLILPGVYRLINQDEILMDQVCLDCMHRRRGKLYFRRLQPFQGSELESLMSQTTSSMCHTRLTSHLLELAHPQRSKRQSAHIRRLVCRPSARRHLLVDHNHLRSHRPLPVLRPPHCSGPCLAWREMRYPPHRSLLSRRSHPAIVGLTRPRLLRAC